jgi:tRNA(Ile)-lysidine synthase
VGQVDNPFLALFELNLDSKGIVASGSSVLLAVSGGIDSMVMLHLFSEIAERRRLTIAVVHVNHQLRGSESDGDEAFVRRVAESLKIPFFCTRVDTIGHMASTHLSKQEAARNLRYAFFEEVRRQMNADWVATAHQADDNAETVLINALRGTGIRGLAGIPERRDPGNIVRPLLFARRHQIEEYAQAHGIEFRNDSSNASSKYTRNFLRKTIIPKLESAGSADIIASLNELSSIMRRLDAMISEEVQASIDASPFSSGNESHVFDINLLRSKELYLQEAIVLEILRRLGSEIDADKVHRVLGLCDLESGSVVQLSKTLHVYRDRNQISFVRPDAPSSLHQQVTLGDSYSLDDFRFSLSAPIPRPASFDANRQIEFVDAAKLGDPLFLRAWREGDWFVPLGMNDRKKVSDFFVDEKVPLLDKQRVPILESNGTIVWICGRRLDDRFKVTSATKAVVRLEYNPTSHHH